MNIYEQLKAKFDLLLEENDLKADNVVIEAKSLPPFDAIGETYRKDYPLLNGKEVMLEARFKGSKGQAFTSSPAAFSGTLAEILAMDIESDAYATGLFFASLNAVMRSLGLVDATVHCRNEEPEQCAMEMNRFLKAHHSGQKILQIGFQPAILDHLIPDFDIRILDLNPNNVGTIQYGKVVEHGARDFADAVSWADVLLVTGSTLINHTIGDFIHLDKPVYFYGVTLAGAAELLGLKRLCFKAG